MRALYGEAVAHEVSLEIEARLARLEPKNREIRAELEKLKAVHAQHLREEREKYGGIFEKQREREKKGTIWTKPEPAHKPPPRKLQGFASSAFGRREES